MKLKSGHLGLRFSVYILKAFKNAPPAYMLIYVKIEYFHYVKNKIDKFRHLASIQ